ncbi:Transcription factor HBP-1b(c1) [Hibiscus syriacus]|uniref:Transcription factor HBP-1b(C1) n=1 Tax=Hibiscus syriacus TaxID=106335 RepID=A0A6A2YUM4_HIBSY|nr:Transcription factor HBP-1b(c1) [Hibiscus syriacus]
MEKKMRTKQQMGFQVLTHRYRLPTCSEGRTIHPFPASNFETFDQSIGFCLEDAVNLSANSNFIFKYSSTYQTQSPRLQLENSQQTNLVSISSGNTENWGESNMADSSPKTDISTDADTDERSQRFNRGKSSALAAVSDSSDRSKGNLDQKTLRRLAQNREAARKSRLRKKAYVQQLESSRLKLTQLEQELQRARQQGIFISSSGDQSHSTSGNGNGSVF